MNRLKNDISNDCVSAMSFDDVRSVLGDDSLKISYFAGTHRLVVDVPRQEKKRLLVFRGESFVMNDEMERIRQKYGDLDVCGSSGDYLVWANEKVEYDEKYISELEDEYARMAARRIIKTVYI